MSLTNRTRRNKRIIKKMDMVQFMEDTLDIKLSDYQKKMIKYVDEHPDCKIIVPRERTSPRWFQAYLICKAIREEQKK